MSMLHAPNVLESPQAAANPEAKAETQPAGLDEKERRLLRVADALLDGHDRRRVVVTAMRDWSVSERSAQLYVKEAMERMQQEAQEEDRVFYLRVSQLQRDKLLQKVFACLNGDQLDPKVLRALTALVTVSLKLLDSRDRTATEIHRLLGAAEESPASSRAEVQAILTGHKLLREKTKHMQEAFAERKARWDKEEDDWLEKAARLEAEERAEEEARRVAGANRSQAPVSAQCRGFEDSAPATPSTPPGAPATMPRAVRDLLVRRDPIFEAVMADPYRGTTTVPFEAAPARSKPSKKISASAGASRKERKPPEAPKSLVGKEKAPPGASGPAAAPGCAPCAKAEPATP